MRILSPTLLAEHLKASRLPTCRVEVQDYGHPAPPTNAWWDLFSWSQLYSDASAAGYHGAAIAGDGSLNRIRVYAGQIYRQRVASPGPSSTFTSWTATGIIPAGPVSISALGNEVLICWFADCGDYTVSPYHLYCLQSLDYGATWSAVQDAGYILNASSFQSMSACHRSSGDIAVAYGYTQGASVTYPADRYLGIKRRIGGSWGVVPAAIFGGTDGIAADGVAIYHDGDYNMVAQVLSGSSYVLQRIVYGSGYRQAAGTFSTANNLDFSAARVKRTELVNNYVSRFSQEEQPQALHEYLEMMATIARFGLDPKMTADAARWLSPLAAGLSVDQKQWQQYTTVLNALAAANAGLTAPFLCKPSGQPVILSVMSFTDRWFYRLKPGTDFYDGSWEKAYSLKTPLFSYGSALAGDGAYLWLSRAYDLYRSPMPCVWTPPAAGSGAGASGTLTGVASVQYGQNEGRKGTAVIELDNSGGIYADPAAAGIDRGKRLNVYLGYRTNTNEESEAARYFIDTYRFSSDKGRALLTVEGIDGWEMLNRSSFPNDVEWNLSAETLSAYDIIGLLVQAIGGTLSYRSRSSLITGFYPHLDIPAGTSFLSVVERIMSLLPDVLYFFGNDAVIVHPQAADMESVFYCFPS